MTPRLYQTIAFEQPSAHIGLLRLNRPHVANAINTEMAGELLQFFTEMLQPPAELRCLLVMGSGDRAFCAGGDLKERDGMTDEAWSAQHAIVERVIGAILDYPFPVIALVNGAAFGGGCELALAADFIYATAGARFALTETHLGIMPGAGGTQTLPRAVGTRRAIELICAATPFSAEEALAWGLVNRVLPRDRLLDEALSTAARIAANGPMGVRLAKHSIRAGMEMDIHDGMLAALHDYRQLIGTHDRREGVRAFIEKREPAFRGA